MKGFLKCRGLNKQSNIAVERYTVFFNLKVFKYIRFNRSVTVAMADPPYTSFENPDHTWTVTFKNGNTAILPCKPREKLKMRRLTGDGKDANGNFYHHVSPEGPPPMNSRRKKQKKSMPVEIVKPEKEETTESEVQEESKAVEEHKKQKKSVPVEIVKPEKEETTESKVQEESKAVEEQE